MDYEAAIIEHVRAGGRVEMSAATSEAYGGGIGWGKLGEYDPGRPPEPKPITPEELRRRKIAWLENKEAEFVALAAQYRRWGSQEHLQAADEIDRERADISKQIQQLMKG